MNPISFRSTYVVSKIPSDKLSKLQTFSQEVNDCHSGTEFHMYTIPAEECGSFYVKGLLKAPDAADEKIENYCSTHHIVYDKYQRDCKESCLGLDGYQKMF